MTQQAQLTDLAVLLSSTVHIVSFTASAVDVTQLITHTHTPSKITL